MCRFRLDVVCRDATVELQLLEVSTESENRQKYCICCRRSPQGVADLGSFIRRR